MLPSEHDRDRGGRSSPSPRSLLRSRRVRNRAMRWPTQRISASSTASGRIPCPSSICVEPRGTWLTIDGEPGLAAAEAHRVRDASKACLSYDIEPMTLGYRQCMATETSRIAASRYEAR